MVHLVLKVLSPLQRFKGDISGGEDPLNNMSAGAGLREGDSFDFAPALTRTAAFYNERLEPGGGENSRFTRIK